MRLGLIYKLFPRCLVQRCAALGILSHAAFLYIYRCIAYLFTFKNVHFQDHNYRYRIYAMMSIHCYLKIHYRIKNAPCSDSHCFSILLYILCSHFLVRTTMQFDLGCQVTLRLQNTKKKNCFRRGSNVLITCYV